MNAIALKGKSNTGKTMVLKGLIEKFSQEKWTPHKVWSRTDQVYGFTKDGKIVLICTFGDTKDRIDLLEWKKKGQNVEILDKVDLYVFACHDKGETLKYAESLNAFVLDRSFVSHNDSNLQGMDKMSQDSQVELLYKMCMKLL